MQDANIRSATYVKSPGGFHNGDLAAQATGGGFKERNGGKQISIVQHGSQHTKVSYQDASAMHSRLYTMPVAGGWVAVIMMLCRGSPMQSSSQS